MVFDPVDYPAPPSTSTQKQQLQHRKQHLLLQQSKSDTSATATGIVSKENDNFQNDCSNLTAHRLK
jgi:hypothetical protein